MANVNEHVINSSFVAPKSNALYSVTNAEAPKEESPTIMANAIAAMSEEQVEQLLREMGIEPPQTLPDNLKRLVSCRESEEGEMQVAAKKHPSLHSILSALGIFLVVGLLKVMRSKAALINATGGLLVGVLLASLITVRFYEKQALEKYQEMEVKVSFAERENDSLKQAVAALRDNRKKLADQFTYLCRMSEDLAHNAKLKGRAKTKTAKDKTQVFQASSDMDKDVSRLAQFAQHFSNSQTGLESGPDSTPSGLPANGTIVEAEKDLSSTPKKGETHVGVDILVTPGTPVTATAVGLARIENAEDGKHVKLYHADGLATMYGPLSEVTVASGQRVLYGQKIGFARSPVRAKAVCLNYQVLKNYLEDDTLASIKPSK